MPHKDVDLETRHKPSGLEDSLADFLLSRQAMLCTSTTLRFYRYTLDRFLGWLEDDGIDDPSRITPNHVRSFLCSLLESGGKDSYIHSYARSIRTFVRFLHREEYIPEIVKFEMPRIGEMKLPVLNVEQVKKLLDACSTKRDRAIILLMIDTGIRKFEVCSLNWENIDLKTGICIIVRGKGKKSRSVILGVTARRALLNYKRSIKPDDRDPVFQTSTGGRLSPGGLRTVMLKLGKLSGVPVTPHALRRTFVVMSLKGGMNIAEIQALMGHATPEMTLHYARLSEEDLITAHQEHGPIDNFLNRKINFRRKRDQ